MECSRDVKQCPTERPEHISWHAAAGLELAQAMAVFGCKVTVLERGDTIMGREDPEASAIVKQQMEADGVDFRLHTSVDKLELAADGRIVAHLCSGSAQVCSNIGITPCKCCFIHGGACTSASELKASRKI